MTSRLGNIVLVLVLAFAVLTTALITVAASSPESKVIAASAPVVRLERIVIVGKRLSQEQR